MTILLAAIGCVIVSWLDKDLVRVYELTPKVAYNM